MQLNFGSVLFIKLIQADYIKNLSDNTMNYKFYQVTRSFKEEVGSKTIYLNKS